MAGNKSTSGSKAASEKASETQEQKPTPVKKKIDLSKIKLDDQVTIRNLAGWNVSFNRIQDQGWVALAPSGTQRISVSEIAAQVNNGLTLFVGNDGQGSHPTLYIEDELTRYYVGFETDERKQEVLTDKLVQELFALPFEQFKEILPEKIVTRAEKYALVEAIVRLKIDSYSKIQFAVEYAGFPLPKTDGKEHMN
jgi:hypothetical protein